MQPNQERANLLIGAVFAELLPAWPTQTHLDARRIAKIAFNSIEQSDLLSTLSLIQWLNDEGYIRFKSIGDAVFHQTVLTEKGLRRLNSVPSGLTSKDTFGEQLTKAAKDVSKDTTKKLIADLVGQMIGGVVKSITSG